MSAVGMSHIRDRTHWTLGAAHQQPRKPCAIVSTAGGCILTPSLASMGSFNTPAGHTSVYKSTSSHTCLAGDVPSLTLHVKSEEGEDERVEGEVRMEAIGFYTRHEEDSPVYLKAAILS